MGSNDESYEDPGLIELRDLAAAHLWPLPVGVLLDTYESDDHWRYATRGDVITDGEGFDVQVLAVISPNWACIDIMKVFNLHTGKEGFYAGSLIFATLLELVQYLLTELTEFIRLDRGDSGRAWPGTGGKTMESYNGSGRRL